jgi:hypothetical protein
MQFEAVNEAVEMLKHGRFHLVSEEVDDRHFGNAYAELKRDKVISRIVRERDRYFMELRPKYDEKEWFDIGLVMRWLRVPELKPYRTDVGAMKDAAGHVIDAFEALNRAFSRGQWRETVAQLNALQERRWQERLSTRLEE